MFFAVMVGDSIGKLLRGWLSQDYDFPKS